MPPLCCKLFFRTPSFFYIRRSLFTNAAVLQTYLFYKQYCFTGVDAFINIPLHLRNTPPFSLRFAFCLLRRTNFNFTLNVIRLSIQSVRQDHSIKSLYETEYQTAPPNRMKSLLIYQAHPTYEEKREQGRDRTS